jgi:Hydrogenase maturation factor
MKIGKLPEPALLRSVLKQINHRREEVLIGPALGQDCAVLSLAEDEVITLSSDPITGTASDLGSHSIHITANDLAAAGAEPIGVMLTIMLPSRVKESALKQIMQDAESTCASLGMEILGGHTEVTDVVNQPVISVTGVGKVKKNELLLSTQMRPEQDIVVSKWVGLEATAILAKEKETQLRTVFTEDFINTAKRFDQYLSVIPEAKVAKDCGASAMHDITEGGILGALWEMSNGAGVGIEVDLRKIPIRQETVEICEFFKVNPYLIMSSGSMLIATDDGAKLVAKLKAAQIEATVIGRSNASNKRIVKKGDEVRYLDKPQADELYRI